MLVTFCSQCFVFELLSSKKRKKLSTIEMSVTFLFQGMGQSEDKGQGSWSMGYKKSQEMKAVSGILFPTTERSQLRVK